MAATTDDLLREIRHVRKDVAALDSKIDAIDQVVGGGTQYVGHGERLRKLESRDKFRSKAFWAFGATAIVALFKGENPWS